MNLFDIDIKEKPIKKKVTLMDMVNERFRYEPDLVTALKEYLNHRRQLHNYPSKVSWEAQLDLLERIPKADRVAQVKLSTLRGYRQVAYEKDVDNIKVNKNKIVNQGF